MFILRSGIPLGGADHGVLKIESRFEKYDFMYLRIGFSNNCK
jgi:hypothetical protein